MPIELKKLGLEIWEEYDMIETNKEKTQKIIELFQRNDIKDLYYQNIKMIEHNQNLVTSLDFVKQLIYHVHCGLFVGLPLVLPNIDLDQLGAS